MTSRNSSESIRSERATTISRHAAAYILAVALSLSTALSFLTYHRSTQIAEALNMTMQGEEPKVTSWRFSLGGGIATHTVTTYRLEGESDDAWALRHKGVVDADAAVFPPIPE